MPGTRRRRGRKNRTAEASTSPNGPATCGSATMPSWKVRLWLWIFGGRWTSSRKTLAEYEKLGIAGIKGRFHGP